MNTEDDVFFTKKLDLMYNFCKYYMLICGQKPCVRKKKWIVTRMAYYIYTYKYRKPSIKSKRKLFTHPLLLVKHPQQKKKKSGNAKLFLKFLKLFNWGLKNFQSFFKGRGTCVLSGPGLFGEAELFWWRLPYMINEQLNERENKFITQCFSFPAHSLLRL